MAADTNLELLFCINVLRLQSLHYGYWEGNETLDFKNLQNAQQRYTETLVTLIPRDVKIVLDVGCGIGDIAYILAEKGYTVTAISPDKHHSKFFVNSTNKNVYFLNSKFEDFNSNQKFDLILMSESQNYFETEIGFEKCTNLLRPGGYLFVSGMFRNNDTRRFEEIRNTEEQYIQKARSFGFMLTKHLNITQNVLPTIKLANNVYRQYLVAPLNLIDLYLTNSKSITTRLVKLFLLNNLKHSYLEAHRFYKKRLNPYLFRKHIKYSRLLFQLE